METPGALHPCGSECPVSRSLARLGRGLMKVLPYHVPPPGWAEGSLHPTEAIHPDLCPELQGSSGDHGTGNPEQPILSEQLPSGPAEQPCQMPCADGLSAPRTGQDLALTGPLSLWEMKPWSVSSLSLLGSLQLVSASGNVALCSVSWVWFASLSNLSRLLQGPLRIGNGAAKQGNE